MTLTRAYILKLYPNKGKIEDIRYAMHWYSFYLQIFTNKLYYNAHIPYFSTKTLGRIASNAQHQAIGIVSGERKAKELRQEQKTSCPEIKTKITCGRIKYAKSTSFSFWVSVLSTHQHRGIQIPAKSHRALNKKLKRNWELSDHCEVFQKGKDWFVRIFVTKEKSVPEPKDKFLGVDVGIRHGVTRSDGYIGKRLDTIIKKEKKSQAERQRQNHKKKDFKTVLKQWLDVEAKRALRRSKTLRSNLVVEHPKVLSNLRVDRWARSYFARRVTEKARVMGVFVQWVNPAYTSITCSSCGDINKQSRVKRGTFQCCACGNTLHADLNAARNIARKGQERLQAMVA